MGVYVMGMKTPSCCMFCPVSNSVGCGLANPPIIMTSKEMLAGRPDWCPLVPVPPHGRLGDLDALAQQIEHEQFHHTHTDGMASRHHVAEYGHFLKAISDTPTIIQAEPPKEET